MRDVVDVREGAGDKDVSLAGNWELRDLPTTAVGVAGDISHILLVNPLDLGIDGEVSGGRGRAVVRVIEERRRGGS